MPEKAKNKKEKEKKRKKRNQVKKLKKVQNYYINITQIKFLVIRIIKA